MLADELSEQKRAFAEAYVEQGLKNQTEAALKAGYKPGSGINAQASRLLKDVKVAAYIKELDERFALTAQKERGHQAKIDAIEENYVKAINYIRDVLSGAAKDRGGKDVTVRDRLTACKEAIRLQERREEIDRIAAAGQPIDGTYVITPIYGAPSEEGDNDG